MAHVPTAGAQIRRSHCSNASPNLKNEEILTLVDFYLRADEPQVEEVDRTSETAENTSLTGRISDFLPHPVSRRHIAYAVVAGVQVRWMSLGGVYLLRHFYRQD